MKCPKCGGEISGNTKFCEYCGSQISVDMKKEQEQLNKVGCPKCGSSNISFNREKQGELKRGKGTIVVRSTVGFCKDCGYTWQTTEQTKKKKTWLWVLGWIYMFPLPLTILLLRKKNMNKNAKIIILVVAWLLYLIIPISGCLSESSSTKAQSDSTNFETQAEEFAEKQVVDPESQDENAIEASATENANALTFIIIPDEKGEYGFENTLNAGTEFEETQIVYHIPAGTYTVTNLGEFQGQIGAMSDETHITENGWEEPASTGDVVIIKPNKSVEFTIQDGYYLEVHVNGNLEFVQK